MQRAQRGIRALALRSAEDEARRQLVSHMHYTHRQGLQWEGYRSCKGMPKEWGHAKGVEGRPAQAEATGRRHTG